MDEAEHLLIGAPGALLDSIALERLGRRSAALVERGDEALAFLHPRGHLRVIHLLSSLMIRVKVARPVSQRGAGFKWRSDGRRASPEPGC